MLARSETLLSTERFNSSDNHSIIITITAILKIFERYLLSARADSKKMSVKQKLYKIRCHPIGKKGIMKTVKTTNNRPLAGLTTLLCLLLFASAVRSEDNSDYLIGLGMADVTGPAYGSPMWGFGKEGQNTQGIHVRLKSRAFIFVERKTPPLFGFGNRPWARRTRSPTS